MKQIPAFFRKRKNWLLHGTAFILPVILLVLILSQTASAQNTYVITDGDQVKVHTSTASDPQRVLNEAGFQLDETDTFTTQTGESGTEITVRRGQIINIDNCGRPLQAFSYGEDLASLFSRMEIAVGGEYQVSLPLDAMTYDGMEVAISWVVEENQTYTAEVPYERVYCPDPTMAAGAEKVVSAGVPGQAVRTDKVKYVNGEEKARTLMEEKIVKEPVQEVVLQGTGTDLDGNQAMPVIGNGVIVLPTGEVLTYTHSDVYKATAYTSWIADVTGTTATGTKARVGAIAVDPKQIPYGTRMFIVSNDGEYIYGIATAEDCGGGIKGKRLDLFFDTVEECYQFGVRQCTVYFLGDADWRGPANRS